jgi:Cytochrome c3
MNGSARRRQRIGLTVGALIGAAVTLALSRPGAEHFHARGPMNSGHGDVRCESCHRSAPGTLRQQLQADARYLVGVRAHPADFGRQPVDNAACLACHDRPNDRHPVFRFNEPRFAEARRAIAPNRCTSCHLEHQGIRVTRAGTFCVNCHKDLRLKVDPLDVPHVELIAAGRWESCLRCHDFHGNHRMTTPRTIAAALPLSRVADYLAGGASPYPMPPIYPAKKPERLAAAAGSAAGSGGG